MQQHYSKKEKKARAKIVEDYLRNFKRNSIASSAVIADTVMAQYMAVQARTGLRPENDASPYYFNGTQVLVIGPICENPRFAGTYNFMHVTINEVGDCSKKFVEEKATLLKVDAEDMVFLEDLIQFNSN